MSSVDISAIFVCGVSGVGKTHLLQSRGPRLPPFHIWHAGEIIGEARKEVDPERLRTLPAAELQCSQEFLIQGFWARRARYTGSLVFLDGHSVIDTDAGFFEIPAATVACLKLAGIVHVTDEEEHILQRRFADHARRRPVRSLDDIRIYQERSLKACQGYEASLGLRLVEVQSGDMCGFENAVHDILSHHVRSTRRPKEVRSAVDTCTGREDI
jgi:adenylate kinase